MRVAFLAKDLTEIPGRTPLPGGCSYYRAFLPMHVMGVEGYFGYPAFSPDRGFGVKETKTTARFGFRVAVLKQIMDRWVPRQIELAQSIGQKIIVDVDDFYDGIHKSNVAYLATSAEYNKVSNREHYNKIIAAADLVTVTTPFLLEHYKKINPNIVMVRNGVYCQGFYRRKHRSVKPVIGWVGAVPYRSGDLETLSSWLPQFLEDNDLMFHHSGVAPNATPIHKVIGLPEERVTTSHMVPIDRYGELFSMDIGLVPLNDIPFNYAKSNIKGLEYAASGIPFVSQGLPEYARLASIGVGRVAYSPEDWVSHLSELLNYRVRKLEAAESLRLVQEEHSIEARGSEWREVLDSLFN